MMIDLTKHRKYIHRLKVSILLITYLSLVDGFCLHGLRHRRIIEKTSITTAIKNNSKLFLIDIEQRRSLESLDGMDDGKNNRRHILQKLCAIITNGTLLLTPEYSQAMSEIDDSPIDMSTRSSTSDVIMTTKKSYPKKPFAPLPALLPAARVKLIIDGALIVTNEIMALDNSSSTDDVEKKNIQDLRNDKISRLNKLIIEREKKEFMKPFSDKSNSNTVFTKTTIPSSNSKLYDDTYRDKMKNLAITDVPLALLSQAGDKRQFSILQSRQRKLEKNSPIRQALNFYTRQLQFDTESYLLNASAEEKKRMIRNDSLPDIQSVIVSDLDLRDLIRNQILDAYDDVRAEIQYQLRKGNGNMEEFDVTELRQLLMRAQRECNQWFSFIDENDVMQAIEVVTAELRLDSSGSKV